MPQRKQLPELGGSGDAGRTPIRESRHVPDARAAATIVALALAAETPDQLDRLWIELDRFAPFRRPVGDRWGNRGLFTAAGGNFDHKLTELITNMHDAVLVRAVVEHRNQDVLNSPHFATLYSSPREAVAAAFDQVSLESRAAHSNVELRSAGSDRKRERTVVFRDRGIGMTAEDISSSFLRVGSSRKDGILWQLGAFGRGGLTVLPNCHGLVVVSRSALAPDAGIVICVVRWERIGNRQTETALYQVVSPWGSERDDSSVLVLPREAAPDFEPGTHVGVVGFRSEGIWVSRLGDERSIDTVIDTRLFEPQLPLTLTTPVFGDRDRRTTRLRGLGARLADNPRSDRIEGADHLPIRIDDRTYQLPVRFFLFASGDVGGRRRFVAHDHSLILNSNGQVHAHWTPAEFRHRTRLSKLADRILVVVDTDPLPLDLRTSLFTADRTELLRHPAAVRLESELVAFLNDWDDLLQANNEMIRDAIRRSNVDRSTAALAERIAKVIKLRVTATVPTSGRQPRSPRPPQPRELLDDPTSVALPDGVNLRRGRTHGIHATLNGKDRFIPTRSTCSVLTTHLDLDPVNDVTVGELTHGRLRISLAVPADAELATAELRVRIEGWLSANGGLHDALEASMTFTVIDADNEQPPTRPLSQTTSGREERAPIALLWTKHESEPTWDAMTVGEVEHVSAESLGELGGDYAHFARRSGDVSLVKLNEEFAPLKAYATLRARSVGDEGVARAKDRYGLGVAVEMLLTDIEVTVRRDAGQWVDDSFVCATMVAAARGVLAVLPDYDALSAEIGMGDL